MSLKSADLFHKAEAFSEFLQDVRRKGYVSPYLQNAVSPSSGRIRIVENNKEREVIQMNTANYLGLASHPKVVKAAHDALEQYGTSMCGVPLIAGTTDVHKELEQTLGRFKQVEEVTLFQTGYAANMGTIAALVEPQDWVVVDKQVHHSILDGVRLAQAKCARFRHSDPKHLQQILERIRRKHHDCGILIVIEGVYGIDGDIPPLPEILAVGKKYDARLMIDECHATGVLGKNGKGLAEHFELTEPVDIVMDSLSKALGSIGGWIGTSRKVADYLRFYARPIVFSVGLSPVSAASALAALNLLRDEPNRVTRIQNNAEFMRSGLADLGIQDVTRSSSAIMSIVIGDELKLRRLCTELFQEGLWVEGIPYPAVPRGQERLRLRVNAKHTHHDLQSALCLLKDKLHKYDIIQIAAR
jgi:8-amino-7-oxononanoate synthase